MTEVLPNADVIAQQICDSVNDTFIDDVMAAFKKAAGDDPAKLALWSTVLCTAVVLSDKIKNAGSA